ncbi:hypothetical protein ACFFNY_19630 [Paenibacillus hodogayensis]|uniref:Uncharacterized protein n=1 Tax=Paenibacillus hodogayensis TaxID=279208 RepID=A0ABV5W0A0_9BACL
MSDRQLKQPEAVERPCRNFCILGKTVVRDPMDGREKLVLSNFAAGSVGNLILIDTETGEGETIGLPGDAGAWALLNWRDEKLIVGTCPGYAYVHSLDLRTRTWAVPLRDESEQYVWNWTIGSDNNVYGGTYPGCVLLRYDPEAHTLENLGKVSDHPKNMYSRNVGAVPGHIIIAGGLDTPFVSAYDIAAGTLRPFASPQGFASLHEAHDRFICVALDDTYTFYDSATFLPMEEPPSFRESLAQTKLALNERVSVGVIPLGGGGRAGVRGQDYVIAAPGQKPELRPIPAEAPATQIHTVVSDEEGRIWGACGFGQTIFRYDPASGDYWNSSGVCDSGGEVYGMRFAEGRLYMTAYAGGDHIVYDPLRPWNQLDNVNPRTLQSVGPELIRPLSRSIVGPDGAIWTGWSAQYGVYGGGLSRIRPADDAVDSWYDPVPGQQIAEIAADDRYVYFTTNTGGNGLKGRQEPCHLAVFSTEGTMVHRVRLDEGVVPTALAAGGGKVWISAGTGILVFDPDLCAFEPTIDLGTRSHCMVAIGAETLAVFGERELFHLNTRTGAAVGVAALPGAVKTATVTPAGELYFGFGVDLYRFPRADGD